VNFLQQTETGGHNPTKTAYALSSGQSILARAYPEAAGWAEINWLRRRRNSSDAGRA